MKDGNYDCVVCYSQCHICLKIAIWCETPWSSGQNTAPHCTLDIKSHPGLLCVEHTWHHIPLSF